MPSYVKYSSNNSGGSWWLTDKHWKALERAGWKVKWAILEQTYTKDGNPIYDKDGTPKLVPMGEGNSLLGKALMRNARFLGALATTAYKPNVKSVREAAEDWESITGLSALEAGCACCGQPHNFTLYRDGKYVDSGPSTSFNASWD